MNVPKFVIKKEEEAPGYAKLVIEPFEQGYGHTVGNSLRRTLQTSIPGAAVVSVRIDGVKHMFSTVKGMKEDVVEFALKLKQLNITYNGDEPIEITLDVKGKGEVTAGDIECPAGVEIVNTDLVLAHLSDDKTKLKAVMTVETGYGYVAAEEREDSTVGLIPLDASFSPIKRVRFDIRETRVGQRTDYDKLILEIWTNGAVEPEAAVVHAAKTLQAYFAQIIDPELPEEPEEVTQSLEELEVMKLTVEELDLPTRIANALRKGGFKTVKDLTQAKKDDIAKVKNLGGKSVDIVQEKLELKGVSMFDYNTESAGE
jgi:DNA-directed RNA polymerase subunit alpha